MAKDPLKLKKYDVGNSSQTKMIYVFLIAIPILLAISMVFYFLGNLTHSSVSVPSPAPKDLEVEAVNEDGSVREGGLDANYADSVGLNKGVNRPAGSELYTDKNQIADGFAKIQVGLRIMPS